MDEFNSSSLTIEWDNIMDMARQVSKNGFRVILQKDDLEDSLPEMPYVIDIEDQSFFYANKSCRDLDFSKILQTFAEENIVTRISKLKP